MVRKDQQEKSLDMRELPLTDYKTTAFTLRDTSRKRQTPVHLQQQETKTETAEETELTTRILIFIKLLRQCLV